jgi:hypothetical protein
MNHARAASTSAWTFRSTAHATLQVALRRSGAGRQLTHQVLIECLRDLPGGNIVASKTHLDGDQVLALALALAAWLVVVSVFGWIDWEMP